MSLNYLKFITTTTFLVSYFPIFMFPRNVTYRTDFCLVLFSMLVQQISFAYDKEIVFKQKELLNIEGKHFSS